METGDPYINRIVLERYRIVSLLGEGGMGAVYEAHHLELGNSVAVKVLKPELSHNEQIVARFVQEAKLASALDHPYIIKVLDAGRFADGAHYIVMEFLRGHTLEERICQYGWIHDFADVLSIALKVLSALLAAHSARDSQGRPTAIIHRDLKPENVMLLRVGDIVKLLDFGIAKLTRVETSGLTGAGVQMGTPSYMSPEQMTSSKNVDARTDIFAVGVILYRMLTGRLPFQGNSVAAIALAHHAAPPPDPRQYRPEIPDPWATTILRCLAVSPGDRPQSVRELANELIEGYPGGAEIADRVARDLRDTADPDELTAKRPDRVESSRSTSFHAAGATATPAPQDAKATRRLAVPVLAGVVAVGAVAGVLLALGSGDRDRTSDDDPRASAISTGEPGGAPAVSGASLDAGAAAATPEPRLVSVRIVTEPAGALVFVDEVRVGPAPTTWTGPAGKRVVVEVQRRDYTAEPVPVVMKAGLPELQIAMKPVAHPSSRAKAPHPRKRSSTARKRRKPRDRRESEPDFDPSSVIH